VTFKLEYYEERTPEEYEPPMFHRIDAEKNAWFFSTHDGTERPDVSSGIPGVSTGFHAFVFGHCSGVYFL
jgi:hypothetical protein